MLQGEAQISFIVRFLMEKHLHTRAMESLAEFCDCRRGIKNSVGDGPSWTFAAYTNVAYKYCHRIWPKNFQEAQYPG